MHNLKALTKLGLSLSSIPALPASKADITPLTLLPDGCRMQKVATTCARITDTRARPLCQPTSPTATSTLLVLISYTTTWIAESLTASSLVQLLQPHATATMTRVTRSARQRRGTRQTISSFINTEEVLITGIFPEVVLLVTPQLMFLFRWCKHNTVPRVSFVYLISDWD